MKSFAMKLVQLASICFVLLFGIQFFATAERPVDDQQAKAPEPRLALLDVSKVFNEHERFRGALNEMKLDIEASEEELHREQREINELVDEWTALDDKEPLRDRLIAETVERQTRLIAKKESEKQRFMNQEADIYASTYLEMELVVQKYCRRKGIALVLRFNNLRMDEKRDRQQVLANVNRVVVYHDRLDITDVVLAELNGRIE